MNQTTTILVGIMIAILITLSVQAHTQLDTIEQNQIDIDVVRFDLLQAEVKNAMLKSQMMRNEIQRLDELESQMETLTSYNKGITNIEGFITPGDLVISSLIK